MSRHDFRPNYRLDPMRVSETRVATTIRLPYDQYREVAARAKQREWSIAHYVSYCISRELGSRSRADRTRAGNHNLELIRDDDALGE